WLQRPGQRLYVVSEDHNQAKAQSSWWLHAADEAALEALARHVWRWGTLAKTLWSRTEVGKGVLGRLRGGGSPHAPRSAPRARSTRSGSPRARRRPPSRATAKSPRPRPAARRSSASVSKRSVTASSPPRSHW